MLKGLELPCYSLDAVVRGITRGAIHGKGTDLDAGALLERRAGGKTKETSAAVSVNEVLRPPLLGPRDNVVHHVGQDVRVVLEKLARLFNTAMMSRIRAVGAGAERGCTNWAEKKMAEIKPITITRACSTGEFLSTPNILEKEAKIGTTSITRKMKTSPIP